MLGWRVSPSALGVGKRVGVTKGEIVVFRGVDGRAPLVVNSVGVAGEILVVGHLPVLGLSGRRVVVAERTPVPGAGSERSAERLAGADLLRYSSLTSGRVRNLRPRSLPGYMVFPTAPLLR